MDDIEDIAEFYNNAPEREHARLDEHQLEFDITWRWLDHVLPPSGTILEIGAATGRYTLELARRDYSVTAVDLAAALIDECRRHVTSAGLSHLVRCAVADARDLSAVSGSDFDAVLMMGPLYHLIDEPDRLAALAQARERLKPGGLLFSVMLSRLGVLGDLIRANPAWIEDQEHVQSMLTRGRRPDSAGRQGFRAYLARVDEIAPLHAAAGFETLYLAGLEPVISADDASYNHLTGHQRELWLDLLFEISTEPAIIAASRHILHIARRP